MLLETVIATLAVSVFSPWMVTLVGPSIGPARKVIVQFPPAGSDDVQVLLLMPSPLPVGMVAPMLAAAFDPVLLMVTEPMPPGAIVRLDAEMLSVVVLGAVTVTCTEVAEVLLAAKLTVVGPSAAGAVNVMAQLEPAGSDAAQLFVVTVMPLLAGITARTLSAADAPLLVTFTVPEPPARNDRPEPETLSAVVPAAAVASAALVRHMVSTFTRQTPLGAIVLPTAQGGGGDAGGALGATRCANPVGKH